MSGSQRAYEKEVDMDFMHGEYWLLNKSCGVTLACLRKWRYRLYFQCASFQGEADIAQLTYGAIVPTTFRTMLSSAWVRYTLLRRP